MSPSVGKSNKSMKICYLFNFSASGTTFSFTHKKKKKKKTKKQTNWDILLCISSLSKGSKRVDSPKDRHGVLSLIFLVISYFVRDLYYCVCFTPYFIFSLYIYIIFQGMIYYSFGTLSSFLSSYPLYHLSPLFRLYFSDRPFFKISLFPHLSSSCLKIIRRSFYISLFQSYFERLSKPHGNCSDGTQTNFTSEEYTYTTRACVKSCVQQHIFNKCGCVTDIMMNDTICSPRNQTERTYPLHLCGFVLLVKRNKRIHINMKCQMT